MRLEVKRLLFVLAHAVVMLLLMAAVAFAHSVIADTTPIPAICPQGAAYADGCAGSVLGTPQFPAMLNGYTARPPWNVAGVDYAVGIPPGTVLTDPAGTLPSGCTYSSSVVTCASGSPTLNSIDFSLHNGTTLSVTGGNVTVTNSKFVVGSTQGANGNIITTGSYSGNLTITNSEIDGANIAVTSQVGQTISISNTGTVTFKYDYFHNSGGDMVDFNTGSRVEIIEFSLFKDIGTNTAHCDTLQWYNSTQTNSNISFNTVDMTVAQSGGAGNGAFTLVDEGGGSITGANWGNNTVIALSGVTNWITGMYMDSGSTASNVAIHDWFIDPTGASAMWLIATGYYGDSLANPMAVTNVKNMVTGTTYTTWPTNVSPAYYVVPDVNGYTPSLSDIYSVTASPSSGTVTPGNSVTLTLNMDVPYTIAGGTPTLTLNAGHNASYTSGSGTASLVFTYTVQTGDAANPLTISALVTNGATFKDAVGNAANLSTVAQSFAGLSVSAGGCPYSGTASVDGCTGAPAGTAQYPSLLSSYGANRPARNVPGVDYYVGVPSGGLSDPSTAGLPGGCSYSSPTVTCSGNNITVSGYDFSLHNGMKLIVNGGATGLTISGNKFALAPNCSDPVVNINVGGTTTITKNTFDGGGGTCGTLVFGSMINLVQANGSTVNLTYNYYLNTPQDVTDHAGPSSGSAAIVSKFNLFYREGWQGHPDGIQTCGGNFTGINVSYNMYYNDLTATAQGNQPFHIEAQCTNPAISNSTISYNTMSLKGNCAAGGNYPGQCSANYGIACKQDNGTNTGFSSYGNYIDWTGAIAAESNAYACTSTTWGSPASNIDMSTGAVLSTTP